MSDKKRENAMNGFLDHLYTTYGVDKKLSSEVINLYGTEIAAKAAVLDKGLKNRDYMKVAELVRDTNGRVDHIMADPTLFHNLANFMGFNLVVNNLEGILNILTTDSECSDSRFYAVNTNDGREDMMYLVSPEFSSDVKSEITPGMNNSEVDSLLIKYVAGLPNKEFKKLPIGDSGKIFMLKMCDTFESGYRSGLDFNSYERVNELDRSEAANLRIR